MYDSKTHYVPLTVKQFMSDTFNLVEVITTEAPEITSISIAPDINDAGTLAFIATNADSETEIFKIGSNGTLVSVVKESQIVSEFSHLDLNLSLNNNDAILYSISARVPPLGQGNIRLILDENGTSTTIEQRTIYPRESKIYQEVYLSDLNSALVAFSFSAPSSSTRELFMLDAEGTTETIASSGSIGDRHIGFSSLGDAVFNNQNLVAYAALDLTFGDRSPTAFERNTLASDGTVIPIEEGSVGDLALNDSGLLVFSTSKATETGTLEEVFQTRSGQISLLCNSDGLFASFEEIVMNNSEEIVFSAFLDDGREGIFAGFDPISDRIVAVGDSLSGSTVVDLEFSAEGLNNEGSISFKAQLADGTVGIYQASIRNQPDINTIDGTNRKDNLIGTTGSDLIDGRNGRDSIAGGDDDDILIGGHGQDILDGGSGDDELQGNRGEDTLNGGNGLDTLFGGKGKDFFVLRSGTGSDVIADYQDRNDRFMLRDGLTFDDLNLVQNLDNVRVELAATHESLATVNSVTVDVLDADDFLVAV